MVTESQPWWAISSAAKAWPRLHQQLRTGFPSAHSWRRRLARIVPPAVPRPTWAQSLMEIKAQLGHGDQLGRRAFAPAVTAGVPKSMSRRIGWAAAALAVPLALGAVASHAQQ